MERMLADSANVNNEMAIVFKLSMYGRHIDVVGWKANLPLVMAFKGKWLSDMSDHS
jgi:hypothetical protein